MGDIVVLTPNTTQILVYLSGCLRCVGLQRAEGEEEGGGTRAKVWLAFRV